MAQLRGRTVAVAPEDAEQVYADFWGDEDRSYKAWVDVDISEIALAGANEAVKTRPVLLSVWVFGLLLAALAGGVPVSDASAEAYSTMRQQAEVVDSRDLGRSLLNLQQEEDAYNLARGWFGACDDACEKAKDRVHMARADVGRLQEHRDKVLAEARHEVGIWSSFGVQDVRDSFWAAWKSGKEMATRCTMMDALFMTFDGRDKAVMLIVRLVVTYVLNLTLGLIMAFFCFLANMYSLIVSYGASMLSGLAFFLLAFVAGLATVSAYLGMVIGTVAGGGLMALRQVVLQQNAALGQGGMPRQQLQQGPSAEPKCDV